MDYYGRAAQLTELPSLTTFTAERRKYGKKVIGRIQSISQLEERWTHTHARFFRCFWHKGCVSVPKRGNRLMAFASPWRLSTRASETYCNEHGAPPLLKLRSNTAQRPSCFSTRDYGSRKSPRYYSVSWSVASCISQHDLQTLSPLMP